jgi:hypothetical protein
MKKFAALIAMLALVITAGCATGGGASDEELIDALLADYSAAAQAGDVDGIMALISDNFSHSDWDYEAESKAELEEFVQASKDEGNFEDVEIDLADVEVEIEGTTAEAYPIYWTVPAGSVTMGLTLTKEGGDWLVTDLEIEGL